MVDKIFSVYMIRNTINGKLYIGKTNKSPKRRWAEHLNVAKNKSNSSYSYIHKSINFHGWQNFSFEVIVECKSDEDAKNIETAVIKQFDSKK